MESETLTVNDLAEVLNLYIRNGCGNYKIQCLDGQLSSDALCVNHLNRTVIFRGHLFNLDNLRQAIALKKNINEAIDNFYAEVKLCDQRSICKD